jgi:hypothetical protein
VQQLVGSGGGDAVPAAVSKGLQQAAFAIERAVAVLSVHAAAARWLDAGALMLSCTACCGVCRLMLLWPLVCFCL